MTGLGPLGTRAAPPGNEMKQPRREREKEPGQGGGVRRPETGKSAVLLLRREGGEAGDGVGDRRERGDETGWNRWVRAKAAGVIWLDWA